MKARQLFAVAVACVIAISVGCSKKKSDDSVTHYRQTKQITYDTAGGVSGYATYTYASQLNVSREVDYSGPGADGVWFTADDVVSNVFVYEYDLYWNMIKEVYYSAPGPDGNWFTADDVVSYLFKVDLDSTGNPAYGYSYLTGPDGKLGTADDVKETSYLYQWENYRGGFL